MESLFTWCAAIGGSIFALQFLMLLMGLEGGDDLDIPHLDMPDVDADVDLSGGGDVAESSGISLKDAEVDFDHHPDAFAHSDGWFVGIVTIRSLVAAVAVFGLTGRVALQHFSPDRAIAIASAAGAGMLYLVGWGFKKLYQLQSDGTVTMQDAVGCTGTVYLTIPGQHQAAGKVTVKVAGRTMEYQAMTNGESLKTGTPIVVTSVISEDTLEIESQIPTESVASGTQQSS